MRIADKIKEVEDYLSELIDIMPINFEEYKELKTKAACERYFEIIIGSVVDLCFLIIKEKMLKIPEEDKEAFEILSNEQIITNQLSEKLKEAKGMRNLIAHEYGKLDDELIFEAITHEFEKDVNEFIKLIKEYRQSK